MDSFFSQCLPIVLRTRKNVELLRSEAHRIETIARLLNGLQPVSHDRPVNIDPLTLLQSATMLLERFCERRSCRGSASSSEKERPVTDSSEPEASQGVRVEDSPNSLAQDLCAPSETASDSAAHIPSSTPVISIQKDPEPSKIATELVRLRDQMLLGLENRSSIPPTVLNALQRQTLKLIQSEGIRDVEKTGPYDQNRQEIVETEVTSDAGLHETVARTVRPGYEFNGQLIRPQEVVIFRYEAKVGEQVTGNRESGADDKAVLEAATVPTATINTDLDLKNGLPDQQNPL